MDNHTLRNYQSLVDIDSAINNRDTKYPFRLNEQAKYTQHQITLYQSNYCHTDSKPTDEQPSVTGGASVNVVFI